MIDKVNTSQLQEILANAAAKQNRIAEPDKNNSVDASLQADYSSLIKQASATSQDDQKKVQKAKELLESGLLETNEYIHQTVRNIVQFGF